MAAPDTFPTDEAILVKECCAGDPAAQRALYRRYAGTMIVVCSRYLPQPEDAQEALMDAFVAFYKGLPKFVYAGPGSVETWLRKIVVNQCLMALRRRPAIRWTDAGESMPGEPYTSDDVLARMSVREILGLVQGLPDGYRTVFNLYAFEELSHAEIASLLHISESTSKSQLHKARKLLQEKIRKQSK